MILKFQRAIFLSAQGGSWSNRHECACKFLEKSWAEMPGLNGAA